MAVSVELSPVTAKSQRRTEVEQPGELEDGQLVNNRLGERAGGTEQHSGYEG